MMNAGQQSNEMDCKLDVRRFGAVGDGKTDDTAAIQKALDAAADVQGGVTFSPGTYCVSRLQIRSNTALLGAPTWSYRRLGGTVLKLIDDAAACLLDLTGSIGARVIGMSLNGDKLGQGVCGIYIDGTGHKEEDSLVLDNTRVAHFSGDAVRLENVWGYTVRNCMLIFNGGNGLSVTRWDGFIYQNIFNNCEGWAIHYGRPNSAVSIVGNRIEWCHTGGVLFEVGGNAHITGNFFDRAGGPAIRMAGMDEARPGVCSITGNIIKRSGARAEPGSLDSSHVRLEDADGVVLQGNTMVIGANDSGKGQVSPSYGIVAARLRDSIIRDNVMHKGATQELMHDLGGHDEKTIIDANIGTIAVP